MEESRDPDTAAAARDVSAPRPTAHEASADAAAAILAARYRHSAAMPLLRAMIEDEFPGRIALASSFGTESAVLLDMAARIDRSLPVLFLNTGKLFAETLAYQQRLIERLGFTDVREIRPDPARLAARDGDGRLWMRDPDLCCFLRKVEPLETALRGFSAWITGRKRFHGGLRDALAPIEAADGRIKISPLAEWRRDELAAYFAERGLPRHPLEADGYPSVGCMPCTDRTADGEGRRDGRWRGSAKTECGIHLPRAAYRHPTGTVDARGQRPRGRRDGSRGH